MLNTADNALNNLRRRLWRRICGQFASFFLGGVCDPCAELCHYWVPQPMGYRPCTAPRAIANPPSPCARTSRVPRTLPPNSNRAARSTQTDRQSPAPNVLQSRSVCDAAVLLLRGRHGGGGGGRGAAAQLDQRRVRAPVSSPPPLISPPPLQTSSGYHWLGKSKRMLRDLGPGASIAVPLRVAFRAHGVHDLNTFALLYAHNKSPAIGAHNHYLCRVGVGSDL